MEIFHSNELPKVIAPNFHYYVESQEYLSGTFYVITIVLKIGVVIHFGDDC